MWMRTYRSELRRWWDRWRLYTYCGPSEILAALKPGCGRHIDSPDALAAWALERGEGEEVYATYVVSSEGKLLVAPRRSEHVQCSGGEPVLAAGELAVTTAGDVTFASNLSTGFCPDGECWWALRAALCTAGIAGPEGFGAEFLFRLCKPCNQRAIVKDSWFFCELCGGELPQDWNFS